jgi:hypothetical protein
MRTLVATVIAVLALVVAGPAAAVCGLDATIVISATGPDPPFVHVRAGALVAWRVSEDATSRVLFDAIPCAPQLASANEVAGCFFNTGGAFTYRVAGFGGGTGTVEVESAEWISLVASRAIVTFGDRLILSGGAYFGNDCSPLGQRMLMLTATPTGRASHRRAVAVRRGFFQTIPWRTRARPHVSTDYRATWKGFMSQNVRVDVRPRVTLRRVAGARLRVAVRSARSYRGRWVALQRRTARGWRFVRTVRLGRSSATRFRVPRRRGVVRVYVPRSVAGRGYVAGFSRPLRLR